MQKNKCWIVGNIMIGIGTVFTFLYVLFGLFWQNPGLIPFYVLAVILIFFIFNQYSIKQQKLKNWTMALLIAAGSAAVAYLFHGIVVLNILF